MSMDYEMMKKMGILAMISGILSVVLYLLHDIVGAMNYPGYDAMKQAVSDLTALDAPSFAVASGYSAVYGIFSCLCCVLLCLLMVNERKGLRIGIYLFTAMEFISAIGYSLFPLTSGGYDGSFQSFMHVYVITILVVLLSIVSLLMISISGFKDGKKVLGIIATIALLLMFIGAAGSMAVPKDIFGLVERFSTYSAVVFTGVLGIYVYMCIRDTDTI